MSTTTLDLTSITAKCEILNNSDYPYYEELREAFYLLFITGCRVQEIFEIERWSIVSGYDVSLLPQKGNNTRYITLDEFCDNFVAAITGQYAPFTGRTYSQLNNLYQRIKQWNYFQTGDKIISLYIYRYRFVKQLQADGHTTAEIATLMGYTSTSTPTAYLEAVLDMDFEPSPIPTVVIGDQTWMLYNLSIDDGLGGIYSYNNDPFNAEEYGYLYDYDAAVRVASSVEGFRFPSTGDFETLFTYLGGNSVAGGKLKETGFDHWNSPNTDATNESNFTLLGGGVYQSGTFVYLKVYAVLWCYLTDHISQQETYTFSKSNGSVSGPTASSKTKFYSVRLIAD